MNQLQKLKNHELIIRTKELVAEERRVTTEVLNYLYEVERRYLYATMGYPSLWEFCVKELGYSTGAAYRRVSAMRLLKNLSHDEKVKTETALNEGRLNLTTLSTVQSFIKAEKRIREKNYTAQETVELLKELEGKSKLETEKHLASISAVAMRRPDQERVVSSTEIEVRFVMDDTLKQKLERIQDLLAHQLPGDPSYNELLHKMADKLLEKIDPRGSEGPGKSRMRRSGRVTRSAASAAQSAIPLVEVKNLRYIPVPLRRQIWMRDQGRCQYMDPKTKRRCHATYKLQIDHVRPLAIGGVTEFKNLRLLCASHNAYAAMQTLGSRALCWQKYKE